MSTQFCTQCGRALVETDKFCTACGAKIPSSPSAEPVAPVTTEGEVPPQYAAAPPSTPPYSAQTPPYTVPTPPYTAQMPSYVAHTPPYTAPGIPVNRFCRRCGEVLPNGAGYCDRCMTRVGEGDGFCQFCGSAVHPQSAVCPACGRTVPAPVNAKSRLAAGLLGIFLGFIGVHNFYLGYDGKAIAQLLMTLVGGILVFPAVAAAVWGLIEGILLLSGSIAVDGKGQRLKE